MDRFAITAEGPSSDIMNRRENPTGHTYLAPHEPARFVPFDPEITERAMESAAWYGRFAAFLSNKARKYEAQRDELREQLETARKALQDIADQDYSGYSQRVAKKALALIGAGQTDKCTRCGVVALNAESLAAGCLNCGYTAGQKGGK